MMGPLSLLMGKEIPDLRFFLDFNNFLGGPLLLKSFFPDGFVNTMKSAATSIFGMEGEFEPPKVEWSSTGNYTPPSTSGMKTSSTLGYQYSILQLVQLALSVGFKGNNAAIAAAIAFAESSGWSANDTIKSGLYKITDPPETSYGLWQINMTGSEGPRKRTKYGLSSNEELYDPNTNAKIAYMMSGGSNFSAWSAYTNKTSQYKIALPKAQAALAQLQQQQSTQSSSLKRVTSQQIQSHGDTSPSPT